MGAEAAAAPTVHGPESTRSFRYDAFLSYDHDDRAAARGIQRGLHVIGRRMGKLHALRVFRDATDLTANPNLWGEVTGAMDESRYLIAVLSPQAAASKWVNKEVAYWLAQRGPDRLMFVVAGGRLAWDEDAARFDPDCSDAALPVLTAVGSLPTEPLYVDVSDDTPWDVSDKVFRRRSPTWPRRFTANPNMNWPARICVNNAAFGGCAVSP
jgi:TIR domain